MLRKFSAIIPIIILMTGAIYSQETEEAQTSLITGVSLPQNAVRIRPNYVPEELRDGLTNIVAAGDGKLIGGDREVLVWSGVSYTKHGAGKLINQLKANLGIKGWSCEPGGTEGGVTVFSVHISDPIPRVVLGFYIPADDALVLAWTEISASNSNAQNGNSNGRVEPKSSSGDLVGTWTNGAVSSMSEKNLSTGAISSRGGSSFKYVFKSNGTFEFIGLMNSTMYGCSTSLFNDKRGTFEIVGPNITLIPNKNFWRKQFSCTPNSNSERDYKLERETFELRTETDEYGKSLICLADAKRESCYRKEE